MLYYKATAGCGVGMFWGVSVRTRTAPVAGESGVNPLPAPGIVVGAVLRPCRSCTQRQLLTEDKTLKKHQTGRF